MWFGFGSEGLQGLCQMRGPSYVLEADDCDGIAVVVTMMMMMMMIVVDGNNYGRWFLLISCCTHNNPMLR